MDYKHPSEIMDEIASMTPTFKGVSFKKIEEMGSVQWPCNDAAPDGTPIMHIDKFVRGKGRFVLTEYVPTDEKSTAKFPLLLTTGRILSQYNVGAQTRRTGNIAWHDEDVLEIHPHDAEQRGIHDGDMVSHHRAAPARPRCKAHDLRSHAAGCGLHHLPPLRQRRERGHHRLLRLGHQLPRIQGDRGPGARDQPCRRNGS